MARNKAQYAPERLRPFNGFQKEGEGYVHKTNGSSSIAAIQKHQGSTQRNLAPNILPKDQEDWIQAQLINQPEQKTRELIRSVRGKARQLINDQQTEDLLINLIDASERPYILELNHKLFTNQDLQIDPFTPVE